MSPRSHRKAWLLLAAAALVTAAGLGIHGRWFGGRAVGPERAAASRPTPAVAALTPPAGLAPFGSVGGAIAGQVTDRQRGPVAGARVCASAQSDALPTAAIREPRCVSAGGDGAYQIDQLPPARYQMSAFAPGYRPAAYRAGRRGDLDLAVGERKQGIDLQLRAGGAEAHGRVRDVGGGVLVGARVVVVGSEPWPLTSRSVAVTDEKGEWSAWTNAGTFFATAYASGYAAASRSGTAPGLTLDLLLTPESVLQGRVVDAESGTPVPQVLVSALAEGGRATDTVFSDEQGSFRIASLQPGRYQVIAEGVEWYGAGPHTVRLGLAETSAPLEIKVSRAVSVAGRIASADGDAPCSDGGVVLVDDQRQTRAMARAQSDGAVVFKALLPGTYAVSVYCRDHVGQDSYPPVVVRDKSLTALEWRVAKSRHIAGVVVNAAGGPVEGVAVIASPKGGDPRMRRVDIKDTTGLDGRFHLQGVRPGTYTVGVRGGNDPPPRDPQEVVVGSATDVDDLRLVLEQGGEIRGDVTDEEGRPQAGVQVVARGEVQEPVQNVVSTLDDGTFHLVGLRPGQYRVAAVRRGAVLRRPRAADDELPGQRIVVRTGQSHELRLVVESQSGVITGDVRDGENQPLADAFVRAERELESAAADESDARYAVRDGWSGPSALTDGDGRFSVGGLAKGRYTLRAYRRGGGEALSEHVRVGARVTLRILATGTLGGHVATAAGAAPESFTVHIASPRTGYQRQESFFHSGGEFSVGEIPAGSYELSVSAPEGTAATKLAIERGQSRNDLRLVLEARGVVRGRVVILGSDKPAPGLAVSAIPVRGSPSSSPPLQGDAENSNITDADGRFQLKGAPAGRVWITAAPIEPDAPYSSAATIASLRPGEETDVPPLKVAVRRVKPRERSGDLGFVTKTPPPDIDPATFTWMVAVIRPDGPAAKIGMKTGDVIVSVDGYDVTALNGYLYPALAEVPAGTAVKLGLAGGRVVEVTAGPPP